MNDEIIRTQIINKTENPITLRNPPNYARYTSSISSNSSLTLKFTESGYFLMPFERVTYRKNGSVILKDRKGFKPPKLEGFVTRFLNEGGEQVESILLDYGETLHLPRGIPITRSISPNSFYAEYGEVIIQKSIPVAVPSLSHKGLMEIEYRPNIIRIKRSKEDMTKLKAEREKAYLASLNLQA